MKTILVPTDFSRVSNNAIDYAAELAVFSKSKLILFNSYHIPVAVTEVPAVIPDLDSLEKNSLLALKEIEKRLALSYGNKLQIECVAKCGFAVDEIDMYATNAKADLIVMGMKGAGYLTEKLIGSVTTSLIQKSKCPVLAIDEHVRYKLVKKIALACDYNETENEKVLYPLIEIARIFKAHIYVLNVENELEPVATTAGHVVSGFIKLQNSLAHADHSFHFITTQNIVEGINEFIEMSNVDMVVMIPRKHSLLRDIFNEPKTKQMAFHSKVPLLTLH
ncbi:MAG: universal stress protein [Bacteroidia bacterium]|jgi:nucleotide-binding universal stress UspA family protein|nr:universal stress protein [Bacteroidia bacterium]